MAPTPSRSIDTATNKPIRSRYLGRAPHEAFFTSDGKEIYAAVRGEDYVSVLGAEMLEEKARIKTNSGPGMILFRPDGRYAFAIKLHAGTLRHRHPDARGGCPRAAGQPILPEPSGQR